MCSLSGHLQISDPKRPSGYDRDTDLIGEWILVVKNNNEARVSEEHVPQRWIGENRAKL